ncbi:MAG: cyclic nucleotide-binding domain-containing protein [Bacteriovoracaceae bacterium]|nr:cyclic nucleotide-binding domain-containing protein [Bacteriovoracaceae bacterium]
MISKRKSILLVEDEKDILDLMSETLEENGLRTIKASDGLDASLKLKNESFDMIISDLHLPKKDGTTLVQEIIQEHGNDLPILVVTGDLDSYKTDISMHKCLNVLEKPFDLDVFAEKVLKILDPRKYVEKEATNSKKIIKKGELLIKQGASGDEMFWVVSGGFEAFKSEDGNEVSLGNITSGELVGEMSFIDHKDRSANVRAIDDSEVLVIPCSKFIKVLESQPQWFKNLVKNLSLRLRETNKKVHI